MCSVIALVLLLIPAIEIKVLALATLSISKWLSASAHILAGAISIIIVVAWSMRHTLHVGDKLLRCVVFCVL